MQWHGGKWRVAPWIIAQFPPHDRYVEVFGGAGSVLLRKPPVEMEVYNDLYDEVVNLFRVLRSPRAGDLIEAIALTPCAHTESRDAYEPADCCVERARRLLVRAGMTFGSRGGEAAKSPGFNGRNQYDIMAAPARWWAEYPPRLRSVVARLRGVTIENRTALNILDLYDHETVLFYLDPPYLAETRASGKAAAYAHEMTTADHEELLHRVLALRGMVAISGYPSALYDNALRGWQRRTTRATVFRSKSRDDVLWCNPALVQAREAATPDLFAAAP